jgi:ERCC4-related helicase
MYADGTDGRPRQVMRLLQTLARFEKLSKRAETVDLEADMEASQRRRMAALVTSKPNTGNGDGNDNASEALRAKEGGGSEELAEITEAEEAALRLANRKRWRCIIFVERKTTAYFISELIGRLETLRFLQVGVQTGYAVNDLATSARQRAVLDAFREGTLNCLVATDVLEEGIDVPECQLVVLFDLRRNIKSLIQSCGRARHAQSEVVVLSSPGGENEQLVRQVVVAESDMRILAQRNAVRYHTYAPQNP